MFKTLSLVVKLHNKSLYKKHINEDFLIAILKTYFAETLCDKDKLSTYLTLTNRIEVANSFLAIFSKAGLAIW